MRQYYLFILFIFFGSLCYSQSAERYSAVNPLIFNYNRDDIMVVAPIKYNNGSNIIVPQPHNYPWEAKLENVMPNVIVDSAA